jgi:hypothetical protein
MTYHQPPPIPRRSKDLTWYLNKLLLIIGIAIIIWFATLPFRCAASVVEGMKAVDEADIVTLSEYGSIQAGMSYEDVSAIIGQHGVEVSSNVIPGVKGVMPTTITAMYTWTNPDGSNMNAIFQNDKLIQRAQYGLE